MYMFILMMHIYYEETEQISHHLSHHVTSLHHYISPFSLSHIVVYLLAPGLTIGPSEALGCIMKVNSLKGLYNEAKVAYICPCSQMYLCIINRFTKTACQYIFLGLV